MILSVILTETLQEGCSQWWLLLVRSPSGTIWQQKKEAVNDFKLKLKQANVCKKKFND